ncbi:MAG: tripartite tricarboxylate transporter substrate binding protein [Pseudomonadota bacterium]|nr:tripartite tricarboxylate transporter substrate binding protein [Pseudomonadota bacterium]
MWAQARASAAGYPSKTVRIIIPFAPGGGTDIVGRVVAAKLQQAWGQPFIVDNKAGGNGTIGLDACTRAPPDGYTLSMVTGSASVNVTLQGNKQPYDLLKDLAPVTQITTQPYVLVVNPNVPAKSLGELIALARAKPSTLTYGSSGPGGLSHLSGELFCSLAKIKMTHVPYKGGNPALQDVIAGQIDMLFSTQLQAHPFFSANRLRVLAVTTTTRSTLVPDVPTMAEAGVPGYEVAGWYGLLAPAATPRPIIDKLQQEIVTILKMPDVKEKLALDGSYPVGSTPAQFGAHMRGEVDKWRRLIQEAGITGG